MEFTTITSPAKPQCMHVMHMQDWKHSYLQSLIEPTSRNLGPFAQQTSSVRVVLNVDPEDNLKAFSNCSTKHEI
jgi:hypothetical protein